MVLEENVSLINVLLIVFDNNRCLGLSEIKSFSFLLCVFACEFIFICSAPVSLYVPCELMNGPISACIHSLISTVVPGIKGPSVITSNSNFFPIVNICEGEFMSVWSLKWYRACCSYRYTKGQFIAKPLLALPPSANLPRKPINYLLEVPARWLAITSCHVLWVFSSLCWSILLKNCAPTVTFSFSCRHVHD